MNQWKNSIRGVAHSPVQLGETVNLYRKLLTIGKIPEFIDLLYKHPKMLKFVIPNSKKMERNMFKGTILDPYNDNRDLIWITEILFKNIDLLGRFSKDLLTSDEIFYNYGQASALEYIEKMRVKYGVSLILAEREIVYMRLREESEVYRKWFVSYHKTLRNDYMKLMAFYLDKRYDPSYSQARLEEDIDSYSERDDITKGFGKFLNYKINGLYSAEDTPTILSIESICSLYDLYFSFCHLHIIAIEGFESRSLMPESIRIKIEHLKSLYFGINHDERMLSLFNTLNDDIIVNKNSSEIFRLKVTNPVKLFRRFKETIYSSVKYTPNFYAFKAIVDSNMNLESILNLRIFHTLTRLGYSGAIQDYLSDLANDLSYDGFDRYEINIDDFRAHVKNSTNILLEIALRDDRSDYLRIVLWASLEKGDILSINETLKHLAIKEVEIESIPDQLIEIYSKWSNIKQYSSTLDLAISLKYLFDYKLTPEILRNLKYTWKTLLKYNSIERPSELEVGTERERLYFFKNICLLDVMDISTSMRSTSALLDERMALCAELIKLDPANIDSYEDEVISITTRRKVEHGLRLFDKTRIYIDEPSIKRWALDSLSIDYRSLVTYSNNDSAMIATVYNKDSKLEEIRESQLLVLFAGSESLHMIKSIVQDVKSMYLSDANLGLNSYLSMRIRHGSFANHLRNPLIQFGLYATHDEDEGKYYLENSWFESSEDGFFGLPEEISRRIIEFSQSFEESVNDFLLNYLQVKSDKKPNGIFVIDLDQDDYSFLKRSAVADQNDFSEFIDAVFIVFRKHLNMNLREAKNHIENTIEPLILRYMEDIRRAGQVCFVDHQAAFFNSRNDQVSRLVQLEIERVKEWFEHNIGDGQLLSFSIREIIDIVFAASENAYRNHKFHTTVSVNFQEPVKFAMLSDLMDIFHNLIANTRKHSQISGQINVTINVERLSHNKIKLTYHSPVDENAYSHINISSILENLSIENHAEKQTTEGGTGLHKILKVVKTRNGQMSMSLDGNKKEFITEIIINDEKGRVLDEQEAYIEGILK